MLAIPTLQGKSNAPQIMELGQGLSIPDAQLDFLLNNKSTFDEPKCIFFNKLQNEFQTDLLPIRERNMVYVLNYITCMGNQISEAWGFLCP